MKKWMLALTLASGVLALSACSSSSGNVATSNAGNVTKDELYNSMKDKYGTQMLQQLTFEKILSNRYKVSDSDVTKKFNEIKQQYGSSFQAALAQSGFKNEADFKKSIKTQLLIEKAAVKDLKITDKEIKDYYNNYKSDIKVRHILVKDLATAKNIKKMLDSGQKFDALAKKYSTDKTTAVNGGDLGNWIPYENNGLDPDFAKAAFALTLNQISGPVKSQFGYHIIQKTAEQPKKPYAQMKSEMETKVIENKLANTDALSTILTTEFKAANVKIDDKSLQGALTPPSPTSSALPVGQ